MWTNLFMRVIEFIPLKKMDSCHLKLPEGWTATQKVRNNKKKIVSKEKTPFLKLTQDNNNNNN